MANELKGLETKQRIDKWLFFCRAVKSRSLGAKLADGSKVRVNGERTRGAGQAIRIGDRVELDLESSVRVLVVKGLGTKRGSAPEAAHLFEDQTPPPAPRDLGLVPIHGGKPEKSERRAYERLRARIFDEN